MLSIKHKEKINRSLEAMVRMSEEWRREHRKAAMLSKKRAGKRDERRLFAYEL
ncbi:hypothetical protein PQR62_17710 [Herbaspirillum lusitanum]|jgi:hypothetical protein|uniref:Uncharacterized protein n=1 Tax=Herbaspirillum lusitanum TaxID=213312 RepID=A0ABW9AFD1_9BURK